MQVINTKTIGQLKLSEEYEDWWESEEVEIPFFDNEALPVTLNFSTENDPKFIEEADQALAHFLKMGTEDRSSISELAYKNCMDFLESVEYDENDAPMWEIKDKNEIWDFVSPNGVYVERRSRRDRDIYIVVECNCAWEQEHGLQLVFRQGKKLTRISDFDGHLTESDAYDTPDEEDELLSKFEEPTS